MKSTHDAAFASHVMRRAARTQILERAAKVAELRRQLHRAELALSVAIRQGIKKQGDEYVARTVELLASIISTRDIQQGEKESP